MAVESTHRSQLQGRCAAPAHHDPAVACVRHHHHVSRHHRHTGSAARVTLGPSQSLLVDAEGGERVGVEVLSQGVVDRQKGGAERYGDTPAERIGTSEKSLC